MDNDSIHKSIVIHLGDNPVEIEGTVDKETGNANYRIAIVPDENTVVENNDSQNSHVFCGWESRSWLLPAFCLSSDIFGKRIAATIEKQNKANRTLL